MSRKERSKIVRKKKDREKIINLSKQIWGKSSYSEDEKLRNNNNLHNLCKLIERERMARARDENSDRGYGYCWVHSCEDNNTPSENHLFSKSWITREIGDSVIQYDLIEKALTPRNVSSKRASTFRGLCPTHDNDFFRYIEGEGRSFSGTDPEFVNTVILRSIFFIAHKLNHKDQSIYWHLGVDYNEECLHKCSLIRRELEMITNVGNLYKSNHLFSHHYMRVPVKSPVFFLTHWIENESLVIVTGIAEDGILHIILSYHPNEDTDLNRHSEIIKVRANFTDDMVKTFLWGVCMILPDIAITNPDVPYARESFFD